MQGAASCVRRGSVPGRLVSPIGVILRVVEIVLVLVILRLSASGVLIIGKRPLVAFADRGQSGR